MQPRVIGKCIYCGSEEGLTKEHIVPFGLDGMRVLLRASCRSCAAVTGAFERDVLRESLGPARSVMGISSRKKKDRPTHYPMRMERDGRKFIRNVPVEEYIPLLPVLHVGLPGYITEGRRHQVSDGSRDVTMVGKAMLRSEDHAERLMRKYGATKLTLKYTFYPVDFARMLAKIAYCLAVEQFGLVGIAEPYVVPAILGKSEDIWHFVGGDRNYPYRRNTPQKIDALLWVDMDVIGGDVMARLRLFPHASMPVYVVVVGRAHDGLRSLFQSVGRRHS